MSTPDAEQLGINVIRGLAMDAPQKANSGHPGTAMALAPLAHVLWTKIMRHDPTAPLWPDRDRFVLSPGHASILLYSMLYLTGYGLTLDDIKDFRQWGSKTPGHPEAQPTRGVEVHPGAGHTAGVEVTTGPLGQGFGNGVGMGMAERILRTRYGAEFCNHHTFVICSDGDLMEGVSHEAASLAGHLGLGRLIYIYDDNYITIDGPTDISYSDDRAKRFEAYGWHVEDLGDVANDTNALEQGVRSAMAVEDKPSMLILRSHIGWPSPNRTDTPSAHGEPLGVEEIRLTKEILGLPADESFWVPQEVLDLYRECVPRGQAVRKEWEARQETDGPKAEEIAAALAGGGIKGWHEKLPSFKAGEKVATRKAFGKCVAQSMDVIPGLVSGGADLTGNTGTAMPGEPLQSRNEHGGRQIAYGIREHGMGAAMTGMALHGGILPIGGTFFIFSDYMRPAVRVAALSQAHVVYVWTHDSIGLGEDGPTHQPVEHLASLRAIPGLRVIRPADANEVSAAWRVAVDGYGPTAIVLTRQDVPVLQGTEEHSEDVERGGYVLVDCEGRPDVVLVGTGSEVQHCVAAASMLEADGIAARVVSLPSWDLFENQDRGYIDSVLPVGIPRLGVEAGSSFGWDRWTNATVSLDRFGASAPGAVNMEKLGFTADNVAARAKELVAGGEGK